MPAFSNEKVDGTKFAFGWSPIRFAFGEGFEFVFFCVSRVLFIMKKSFELNASKKLLGVEFGAEFVGFLLEWNKIQTFGKNGLFGRGEREIRWNGDDRVRRISNTGTGRGSS